MRKLLFALLLSVLTATAVQSQYFSYGAKLGLGFPGFQDEIIASERITPSFNIMGNIHITRSFLLQMEAGYELKGNRFTYETWDDGGNVIEDSVYTERTNMGYVSVPLFFKYNLGRSNKFYAQLGGYYSYLLHARFSGMMHNALVSKVPIKEGLAPFDLGLVVGGGLETPVRRGLSMLLDVKYNYGLKDLNANPAIVGKTTPLKTRNFIMSIGVVLDVE